MLGEIFRKRTTADWVNALDAAGVPCGPITRWRRAFSEPQGRGPGNEVEPAASARGRGAANRAAR